MSKPQKPCRRCGNRTVKADLICQFCVRVLRGRAVDDPERLIGLIGGSWVINQRTRALEWVADGREAS